MVCTWAFKLEVFWAWMKKTEGALHTGSSCSPAPVTMHGHAVLSGACRTAARAIIRETEYTGRERRARAFHFGDFEHVRRRSFRPRDSHGRGARSSSSSAQVWEVGMGTMGVCGAGGGEAARTLPWRRVAQGEGRWPRLGFVSGGEG